ncbi:outer membrane beta-barrel protein [Candidatus Electronema sp. TJ]|uniref:outer membrane beta-barrel protein n=1 Tax=Candidatus Electronema sp. TJ TaxID=3401573 RepID=UPI003AA7CB09
MKKVSLFLLLTFALCAGAASGEEKKATADMAEETKETKNEPTKAASGSDTSKEKKEKKKSKDEDELEEKGHVFGFRNSYGHAALSLNGEWTDNLYNHRTEKVDNFLTRISPAVWFTWPRRSRRPLQLALDNTATGGTQYSLTEYDVFNKYQVYLGGRLDFMNYSANSELNHTESGFEGLIQYQPGSRLTLRVLDKYSLSQDIFNITEATAENNRVYDSNLFGLGADWQFSDKFSAKVGYKNFLLLYEDTVNDFMNRSDNGFEAALGYEYSPKTKFFLGGHYLLAAYDENKVPDNGNTYLNIGMNWQATVKTSLMAKIGYQQVRYDYEDVDYDQTSNLFRDDKDAGMDFEIQGIWQMTRKSSLLLNAKYNIEQTDSLQALNKSVFAGRIAFDYRFSNRLRGDINFIYEDSEYEQFEGENRLDERWYVKPELQYALTKWLFLNLYGSFDKKDSSFDELDYESRTIGLGVRASR